MPFAMPWQRTIWRLPRTCLKILHLFSGIATNCYPFVAGLNRIPNDLRLGRALLRLYECRLHYEMMQTTKAEKLLWDIEQQKDQLFDRYSGDKRVHCEDLFHLLSGMLKFIRDPLTADIEELEKTYREFLPRTPALALISKISMAVSYISRGEMQLAVDALKEVEWETANSESPYYTMLWFSALAIAELHRGRLTQVENIVNEASDYLVHNGLSSPSLRFLISSQKAWLHFYRCDLAGAEEILEECLPHIEKAANRIIVLDVTVLHMWIHLSHGRFDEATGGAAKCAFDGGFR